MKSSSLLQQTDLSLVLLEQAWDTLTQSIARIYLELLPQPQISPERTTQALDYITTIQAYLRLECFCIFHQSSLLWNPLPGLSRPEGSCRTVS